MSSGPGTQGSSPYAHGPPYPPRNGGLGGTPTVVPDVPVSAVLLVLYLILGVTHIKIFKSNKHRGHKFIFNAAILGLCKVRIITMSLRIAWACYPRNAGLAMAANIFVYAGTIILYMLDWFFVQRIVRAQHTRIGWCTAYRVVHRAGLACLAISLLMLITSQIWQAFTLDSKKLEAFHAMFLTGQTYFTAFCLAPAVLVLLSLIIPRTEVEKFGAGRLRINITILLIAVTVLSVGQIFRCILAWIPPTPLFNAQHQANEMPWYFHKACFYAFNFVTEIIVIVMFALVRVDLRFHVPNGSRKSGDYSSSRVNLNKLDSEKSSAARSAAPSPMVHQNNSSQTLHRYQSSVFDDTQTLADSLRYPSSTLEVDQKTGNWKVKRLSGETSRRTSISFAAGSRSSLHDRNTLVDSNAPPVPEIPEAWPLPDAVPPRTSVSVLEHTNPPSSRGTPQRTFELENHHLNDIDVGDAVTDALTKLEMNSTRNRFQSPTPPPTYNCTSLVEVYKPTLPAKNDKRAPPRHSRNRSTPSTAALDLTTSRANSSSSSLSKPPTISEAPELPRYPPTLLSQPPRRSNPSLLISSAGASENGREVVLSNGQSETSASGRLSSSKYSSDTTTSSDARENATAQEEFRRFSYEAPPRE